VIDQSRQPFGADRWTIEYMIARLDGDARVQRSSGGADQVMGEAVACAVLAHTTPAR